ncbi:MAG: HlyD family efflux transporter periplasmic adaptor subunit [Candidatus Riflebacteria bacterium]|nr:HlyD family efflux transporter periplasmic adaptor subunit [Candidatus Riflebacteria bacterium]
MINNQKFFFLLFLLITTLYSAGCNENVAASLQNNICYHFKTTEKRSVVKFRGYVDSGNAKEISIKPENWGRIAWLIDEGQLVASGQLVVKISMDENEKALESFLWQLKSTKYDLDIHNVKSPGIIQEKQLQLNKKQRELKEKQQQKSWLFAGKKSDEKWRAETDLKIAEIESEAASLNFELHRKVLEKGFDSPFSLRKQEIEKKAKIAGVEFAKRKLESVNSPPFPEEIIKSDYKIQVASGEVWMAANQLESASVSNYITQKGFQYSFDEQNFRYNKKSVLLNERECFAPAAGIVVYPKLWGNKKISPGQEVWGGFVFLKVVATDSFILDCAVDESVSSLIKVGKTARVVFDTRQTETSRATVSFVGKSPKMTFSNSKSDLKKFPVQLKIENSQIPLLIGMKASIEIEVASATGVFIPRDLIETVDEKSMVKFVSGGSVASLSIDTESFDSDFVRWLNPPVSEGELRY